LFDVLYLLSLNALDSSCGPYSAFMLNAACFACNTDIQDHSYNFGFGYYVH